MGGASTGSGGTGGGTVGPAGVKVDKKGNKKYGTALDAKLTSNRFENNNNNGGGGSDNNGNQVVQAPKVIAPTTAEVSQATATDTTEDTIETRKKKAKATGRSITILNRAKGISSDEGLTLGKRSLLGS